MQQFFFVPFDDTYLHTTVTMTKPLSNNLSFVSPQNMTKTKHILVKLNQNCV